MPPVLQYAYKGTGEVNREKDWYSQAIRIGPRIETAGQGGWNPETNEIYEDINQQIDQAFSNVDLALRDAGGLGWSQVFRVNSYHIPLDDEAQAAMQRNFRKWLPERHPTWTCVEVTRLGGGPRMRVEIEVAAWDEEGADGSKGNPKP